MQKVTYTANHTGSPGMLKFTVNASGISFLEGDVVRFSVDGQVVFLGWVFTKSRNRYVVIDVTCYDQLRYTSDKRLKDIVCYEDGKPLPVEDGYIILNRGLAVGDKVLLLRVMRGRQFMILSRIFERGNRNGDVAVG